jgi:hypothetical protein
MAVAATAVIAAVVAVVVRTSAAAIANHAGNSADL